MSAQELDLLLSRIAEAAKAPKEPFSVQRARDSWYVEHGLENLPANVEQHMELTGTVQAEWLKRKDANPAQAILWLHGGGYICGSIASHRPLTFELAKVFDGLVVTPEYRLAPEHPYPAAVDDAFAAYKYLLGKGFAPGAIGIGGDSAAGGLVVGLLLKLRDEGEPLPAGGWSISPFSDFNLTGETLRTRADGDPIVFLESLELCAEAYLGQHKLPLPYASPVGHDLTGLPPLLIQVGSKEICLDDAIALARTASLSNVMTTLEVWPSAPHVWHLMSAELSEGRDATARGATWLHGLFAAK
jgi:acetyl esterase/lipase